MRRLIIVFTLIIFLPMLLSAQHLKIEAKSGQFRPSENAFSDVYGNGWRHIGEISLGVDINNLHGIDVWINGKHFNKKGKLTYTEEETKVKMLGFGTGLRYRLNFLKGILYPYAGLGFNYNQFIETNKFGELRHYEWGYEGQLGIFIRPIKRLLIDVYLDYTYCKMKPEDIGFNIGGIAAGVGLGYEF